ncbi:hypothetical protein KAZ66_04405 [Candidatus Woesebacteria bacterium]|nr:hypothetical protein [Candidatus Woesebacteria bacterium]
MKRYIDLFAQQINQNKYLIYLNKAKKTGLILLFTFLVILICEAGLWVYFAQQTKSKQDVKKKYNTFIIQNQVFDSKINYFAFKFGLLKQHLNTDANVSYYYGLLSTFLTSINTGAIVSEFSLTNEQSVIFSLNFSTYEQAVAFMSRLESEKLPDYFSSLKLKEFTISNQENSGYVLEFQGTFKKVTNAI